MITKKRNGEKNKHYWMRTIYRLRPEGVSRTFAGLYHDLKLNGKQLLRIRILLISPFESKDFLIFSLLPKPL
jgi:hypothetical protein